MNRYIEQLIEDIHHATWNINSPNKIWEESEANPDDEIELEDISYVEQYIYGEEQAISEITGIDSALLPPFDQLRLDQQALMATELEKLLLCYHFHLDFPENFPSHLRYPFIKDLWDEYHVPLSFGENHIEFCDHEEGQCPFPGYCPNCEEVAAQMKFDEEHSNQHPSEEEDDNIFPF